MRGKADVRERGVEKGEGEGKMRGRVREGR